MPSRCASSATARDTAPQTLALKTLGMMYSSFSSSSETTLAVPFAAAIFISSVTFCAGSLDMIAPGDVVGLGSGRASTEFIKLLGARVRDGFPVRGVPTSRSSEQLALSLGIPLVSLEQGMPLTLTVDGADEVDPNLDLIKGYGRALLREKIVAAASRRLVILVGEEKLVPQLGTRGKLPVEVVPFALPLCTRRLAALGLR